MSGLLQLQKKSSVLRLTLNDPGSRNSLSDEMLAALHAAFLEAETDHTVSVIVIAAEGPVFCAGHNLKELTARRNDPDRGRGYFTDVFARCSKLMQLIMQHRCAIIAEVQGLASAAGCQLVASCDLAYASKVAKFCTPGVNIGLFCSTPMTALSRNVASKHALEMLLTGDVYDADYALRIGLVNAVVDVTELTSHVKAVTTKLSSKSVRAIAFGKKLFHAQLGSPLDEAYKRCSEVMVANMMDADAAEGINAFLEKRNPQWGKLD